MPKLKEFVVQAESAEDIYKGRFLIRQEITEIPQDNVVQCPDCYSRFVVPKKVKEKGYCFCMNCGKTIFVADLDKIMNVLNKADKWGDFPYVGENIEQGNGLP